MGEERLDPKKKWVLFGWIGWRIVNTLKATSDLYEQRYLSLECTIYKCNVV